MHPSVGLIKILGIVGGQKDAAGDDGGIHGSSSTPWNKLDSESESKIVRGVILAPKASVVMLRFDSFLSKTFVSFL